MAIFELQGPDGAIYEVDAPDETAAIGAFQQMLTPQTAEPQERPRSQVLMDEYKRAEAAGDFDTADRLLREASYAATQDGTAPDSVAFNPATGRMEDMDLRGDRGRMNAAAQGLGQGVSFGTMDEVVGGLYGLTGPGTYEQNRDYALASMRSDLDAGRENYPITAYGSEIAGGIGSGIAATARLPVARTMSGTLGQNIGVGAGLGAVQGFATGEDGPENRLRGSLNMGAFGGIAGAAAQPLAWGARTVWNALSNAGRNVVPSVSTTSVGNALSGAVQGSGRSSDDVMNALAAARTDGQDVFTLADALGISGQRTLSGAVRQGGEAKRVAAEFLDSRQAGQGERLSRAISDALGIDDTAAATKSAMTAARGQAADAAYDAARRGAGPVDIRGVLAAIDDRIGPMQGSGIRGDGIDSRLASYRSRLASQPGGRAFPGSSSVELSDFDRVLGVKQAIQDDIGAAVLAGRNNEARELGRIVTALDEALEGASDGYRAANDGFRAASREIDQIDAGAKAARPGQRPDDTINQYVSLKTDPQRQSYRVGYGDQVLRRIETAAEGANKARPLTSQKMMNELAGMSVEPNRLIRQIDRENIMFQTRGMALGGSQTADNLADMATTNALANIPTTFMGFIDAGIGAVNSLARGQNAATREAIVRALLSTGDEAAAALASAVARGEQLSAQQIGLMRTILVGGQQTGGQLAK